MLTGFHEVLNAMAQSLLIFKPIYPQTLVVIWKKLGPLEQKYITSHNILQYPR